MNTQPQIVIFEGPDGSGKSTVARVIGQALRVSVDHHGPYIGETQIGQRYLDAMAPAIANQRHAVLDRSWLSEPIYGDVFRAGVCRISTAQRRMLQRCALSRETLVVICLPSFETCRRNYVKRKALEYLENEAQLHAVWQRYAELRSSSVGLTILRYDYESTTATQLLEQVRCHAAKRSPNNGPGIGRWAKPRCVTLLVGEQMGKRVFDGRIAHAETPFVSFSNAGCAAWLTEQLEIAGVSECDLYWINAQQSNGRDTDARFVRELQPRRVIAMGRPAMAWCTKSDLAHVAVDHPQFWKRFHHHEEYPLIKELQA